MTQTEAVYRMLRDHPEGITAMEALYETGTFRLAARIADLRGEGINIDSTMVTLPNGKRVARYTLVEPRLWGP